MKHKTSELSGALLDAAVAKAYGIELLFTSGKPRASVLVLDGGVLCRPDFNTSYSPSTDWALGGPIIERERIVIVPSTGYNDDGPVFWTASCCGPDGAYSHYIDEPLPFSPHGQKDFSGEGETPLIAAMRAYVASKLGDEVEL